MDLGETASVGRPANAEAVDRRPPAVGASLGRYVVLEEVGRGGMGRVLRAYDPKLQREVALKELRSEALGEDGAKRLVREARAMAKLSHPNVVAVYDVETVAQGRLVLAMEYVAGGTLRSWVRAGQHDWPDVVDRFVAAGRGLAAAHLVGLLHRDFKPANVLVGEDGAIKVTDFGLAKGTGESHSSDGLSSQSEQEGELLTLSGVVVGTPLYMAPEQYRGGDTALTAAVDQYAFCVALWQTLCGEAPFRGKALAAQKHKGPPAWTAASVPRPIVEAVRRGLAVDPTKRWPSMDALLEALAYDPTRRRNRALLVLGGVAVLLGSGASWRSWAAAHGERCTGAAQQLAGVWDEARQAGVEAAILGIGASYSLGVWKRTAGALDEYAEAWTAMHAETCEATTVRGEQSAAVMDLRMACLHRAKTELEAVTVVLTDADAQVVRRAHELTAGLHPLSRCADVEALQADVEPPLPEEAQPVEEIRKLLAAAKAKRQAGHYAAAKEKVEAAKEQLAELEYGPVRTQVALAEGYVLGALGDDEAAERVLREALRGASTWRQAEALRDAASGLLYFVGYRQQRAEAGLRYLELAQGVAQSDPRHEASVLSNLGLTLFAQGKYVEAEAEHRRALALREGAVGPEHPEIASSRNNLAIALSAQGKVEEAEAEYRRALALREQALGGDHPLVGAARANVATILHTQGKFAEAQTEYRGALALLEKALGGEHRDVAALRSNLAAVLDALGKYPEAEKEGRRALALWEKALGPEHPSVAVARGNLANTLEAQGKYAEAEREHRRALELHEKALGSEHPEVAGSHNNLANTLDLLGKHAEAEQEHRRALALREKVLGPEHPDVAQSRTNLATALFAQGKYSEAEEESRRALVLREKTLGPEHPEVAGDRINLALALAGQGKDTEAEREHRLALALRMKALGDEHPLVAESRSVLASLLLDRGRPQDALPLAEQAWHRNQHDDVPPLVRAQTAFVLARALWQSNSDAQTHNRAVMLAERAQEAYRGAGDAHAEPMAEVDGWLRRHPIR